MKRASKRFTVAASAFGVAVLALTGCGGSADAPEPPAPTTAVTAAGPDQPVSADEAFVDDTLTLTDMTVKITDVRTIPVGQPGNEYGEKPVIAFWYEVTNVSGGDLDPTTAWITSFTAYQDNDPNTLNELSVGMLPDDQFLETQTQKIKEGGTVANAIAYELDDESTPVELVASADFGVTELGRATFTIG